MTRNAENVAKKSAKSDRQAKIDEIRKKQKGSEKRRNYAIVGVASVIALVIVGVGVYQPVSDWWSSRQFRDTDLSAIGAPASDCQEVVTKAAEGTQDHVDEGTPIDYPDAPPASGTHYFAPAPMERKLYTAGDRPDLGTLVHNLEHGYTILWYDETAAGDEQVMEEIRAISDKFPGVTNFRNKFKAAPWTPADENGASFPEGQHIAFTHWSAGGSGVTDPAQQVSATQYCSAPSGEALSAFMDAYPYTDSPEPGVI